MMLEEIVCAGVVTRMFEVDRGTLVAAHDIIEQRFRIGVMIDLRGETNSQPRTLLKPIACSNQHEARIAEPVSSRMTSRSAPLSEISLSSRFHQGW